MTILYCHTIPLILNVVTATSTAGAASNVLLATRIIIGLLQGCCYPTFHGLWGNWAPPQEISRLVAIQFAGSGIGNCVMRPVAGVLAAQYGWPSIFYFTGSLGLIWAALWFYFCFDSPSAHPTITEEERSYIGGFQLKSGLNVDIICVEFYPYITFL